MVDHMPGITPGGLPASLTCYCKKNPERDKHQLIHRISYERLKRAWKTKKLAWCPSYCEEVLVYLEANK
jgi:hypothetical protein